VACFLPGRAKELSALLYVYKSELPDNRHYKTNSLCLFVHKRVYITDKKEHCCVSSFVVMIDALLHFERGYCAVNVCRRLHVLAKTARGCLTSACKFKTTVGGYSPLRAATLSLNRGEAMENM